MRIVSWNINGIRAAAKKGFREKAEQFQADIIGLQETKANPEQVLSASDDLCGFHRFANSAERPGYSGVALFSKTAPTRIITHLGQDRFDREGRVIAAYYDDLLVVNVYFPNGQGKNGDNSRVPYKLEFYDALFNFLESHRGPIFVMGDFNTAHTEIDLARPKENKRSSGFLPEERESFSQVLNRGYIDTFRHFYKDPHHYTWWSLWGKARERNVGWRIDGVLANNAGIEMVRDAFIWPKVMGSDHCPVGIDLKRPLRD